ncbi:MAG: HAMP domain-containing histidine kinase, partial [Gemmatimonadaceae bacterium]|nr:HAMP domain-containing histidine kinase [Gemmatimonadaceae bacterium]
GPTGNLGLGLYIADRIVSAHKGKIEVDSSEERGTTFTVRLPRTAPPPA